MAKSRNRQHGSNKLDDEIVDATLKRLRSELQRLAGSRHISHGPESRLPRTRRNMKEQNDDENSDDNSNDSIDDAKNKHHRLSSLWQLFASLDENSTGKIGIAELKKCLGHIGIKLSDKECTALLKRIGNDGKLDLDSFIHFIEIDGDFSYNKYKKVSHLHHHHHHHRDNENHQEVNGRQFGTLRSDSDRPKGAKSPYLNRRNKRSDNVKFAMNNDHHHQSRGQHGRSSHHQSYLQGERSLRPPIVAITPADIS